MTAALLIALAAIVVNVVNLIFVVHLDRRSRVAHEDTMSKIRATYEAADEQLIRDRRMRGEGTGFDTEL